MQQRKALHAAWATGLALLLSVVGWAGQSDAPAARKAPTPFSVEDVRAEQQAAPTSSATNGPGCYLVVLVDAKGIDYSSPERFLKTMAKHPRGDKQDRSIGHAWLILAGPLTWLECGHTGEFGLERPGYRDSVQGAIDRADPNPIATFWTDLKDGRREAGSGGHEPSAAVRFDLTQQQYESIRVFIADYDYSSFSIREKACTAFVTQAATLADVTLGHLVTLDIPMRTRFQGKEVQWWSDPRYSRLTFGSPDVLEKSLKQAVENGIGRDWLKEYRKTMQPPTSPPGA
jgi:hypothetical protein